MSNRMERILWSIALPGFGQILNRHLVKGVLFIALEFIINNKSRLNSAIIYSFYGNTELAVEQVDYQWLMFYPCIYIFAIWDAFNNAESQTPAFSFLPFVFCAYLGTIGVIYSPTIKISGFLLGPILLPILCIILGVFLGEVIRLIVLKYTLKLK